MSITAWLESRVVEGIKVTQDQDMDSLECQAMENGIKLKGNMLATKYLFLFSPYKNSYK